MLNFEDEMKAVKKGYVVLDLDEYNRLRDEIAAANMKAYEAEQLANRRIAEATKDADYAISTLLTVEKRSYGDYEIDIRFNKRAIRDLAISQLLKMYSAEELEDYTIKHFDDMCILDEVLATRKSADEK